MSDGRDPWIPAALGGRDDLDEFLFVVVEEQIDDMVGLVASRWPSSGGDGAPRFGEPGPGFVPSVIRVADGSFYMEFELSVPQEELEEALAYRRLPGGEESEAVLSDQAQDELRRRSVAVGDTFAILPSPGSAPEELAYLGGFQEVIDITPEAREAAKAAMYSALTPPLDPDLVEEMLRREDAGGEIA
jgi:hypothetical protein